MSSLFVNALSFRAASSQSNKIPQHTLPNENNVISQKGETALLVKGTFFAGLVLGARLIFEIFDGDFLIETAGKKAAEIVEKTRKNTSPIKKNLIWIGATAAILAAGISGFALLYTMFNAPKIAYKSKINTFSKGKEMDVYIKANNAEKELYTQLNQQALTADNNKKDELRRQYVQLMLAKNKIPNFVHQK